MSTPKHKPSVLFMDDEINSNEPLVDGAIEAIEKAGYDIDAVPTISDAIDAFYEKNYGIFILDIDMSKVPDKSREDVDRGTKVAQLYRSLDNGCQIIMYSGAGTVDDWFNDANCHVYAYVFKNDPTPIETLLAKVDEIANIPRRQFILPQKKKSGTVLIGEPAESPITREKWEQIVDDAGDFSAKFCPVSEIPQEATRNQYVAIAIAVASFPIQPDNVELLNRICQFCPEPQVVLACEGHSKFQTSILNAVNARPFRLIDLLKPDPMSNLSDALKTAAFWYGGNETFSASMKYVRRAAENIDWAALDEMLKADIIDYDEPDPRDGEDEE